MVHHRHVPENSVNGHSPAEEDTGYERMLIDEGLELLQAFRSIKSKEVRQWICRIVDMIAADGKS